MPDRDDEIIDPTSDEGYDDPEPDYDWGDEDEPGGDEPYVDEPEGDEPDEDEPEKPADKPPVTTKAKKPADADPRDKYAALFADDEGGPDDERTYLETVAGKPASSVEDEMYERIQGRQRREAALRDVVVREATKLIKSPNDAIRELVKAGVSGMPVADIERMVKSGDFRVVASWAVGEAVTSGNYSPQAARGIPKETPARSGRSSVEYPPGTKAAIDAAKKVFGLDDKAIDAALAGELM